VSDFQKKMEIAGGAGKFEKCTDRGGGQHGTRLRLSKEKGSPSVLTKNRTKKSTRERPNYDVKLC